MTKEGLYHSFSGPTSKKEQTDIRKNPVSVLCEAERACLHSPV